MGIDAYDFLLTNPHDKVRIVLHAFAIRAHGGDLVGVFNNTSRKCMARQPKEPLWNTIRAALAFSTLMKAGVLSHDFTSVQT